jgi:hypothetical protein
VAAGEFVVPRTLRPDLPPALEAVVMRALQRDPSARHESVIGLGRALMPFASMRAGVLWSSTFTGGSVAPVAAPAPISKAPAPETPWPARGGDTVALTGEPPARAVDFGAATPPAPSRRWIWPVAAAAFAVVGVAAWLGLRPPEATGPIPVYVTPPAPLAAPRPTPPPAEAEPPQPAQPPTPVPERPTPPAAAEVPRPPQRHPGEARRAPARPKTAHRAVQRTSNQAPVVD